MKLSNMDTEQRDFVMLTVLLFYPLIRIWLSCIRLSWLHIIRHVPYTQLAKVTSHHHHITWRRRKQASRATISKK